MEVLVLGGNGLLGSAVVAAARARSNPVSLTYHSAAPDFEVPATRQDVRDVDGLGALLDERAPDVVVNCAAMTDVDGCESARDRAFEINADAPGALTAAATGRDVGFVHVSTDYVFDGRRREPYAETADPNPIQTYGESKLAGDRAVLDHDDALVVRPSFVYGRRGDTGTLEGFPAWVDGKLAAGESVPLFADQWVTPSRAGATAETILDLVEAGESGLFNVACRTCTTPYEFGLEVASLQGYDPDLVQEGSMTDVERDAARPTYSCLDAGLVERTLGRDQPTLEADLRAVF